MSRRREEETPTATLQLTDLPSDILDIIGNDVLDGSFVHAVSLSASCNAFRNLKSYTTKRKFLLPRYSDVLNWAKAGHIGRVRPNSKVEITVHWGKKWDNAFSSLSPHLIVHDWRFICHSYTKKFIWWGHWKNTVEDLKDILSDMNIRVYKECDVIEI